MAYRKLSSAEIASLERQSCRADDWQTIRVDQNFSTRFIINVTFGGQVKLGVFNREVEIHPGIKKHSGLYDCAIFDCVIEDDVYIANVKNLAHYHLEKEAVLENVDTVILTSESYFGNGTELEILNEAGGRELPIFDRLSAQIAYFLVLYQHDQDFIKKLKQVIAAYVETRKSDMGLIGQKARIVNSGSLRNIRVGAHAQINGALRLENGTIASNAQAPVMIGAGVMASHFIILSGSTVDGGAILSKCFVGQGVQIGKQYSAENSAFFANCEGFHGEACSIFAGPYTVTHHKSTLLIAGLFSFYNAGSGTNQSNHMYKLGPVHQGILERGAKTGSFSYMLWPSRVGAFSAVIGKHYVNFDTQDFPFSYINEEKGMSVLTPAMNLFTVGTRRDSAKWAMRDKRKDPEKFDIINFDLFNPYIIGRMRNGQSTLMSLYESTAREKELVQVKGLYIKRLLLKRCAKYYDIAIHMFIGSQLLNRMGQLQNLTEWTELMDRLKPGGERVSDKWIDMAGMIAPESLAQQFMDDLKGKRLNKIEDLLDFFRQYEARYADDVWAYTVRFVTDFYQKPWSLVNQSDLVQIITHWKENSLKLNSMILADAQKEFDSISQIGFGIDGGTDEAAMDFSHVRGSFADNKFVKELQAESDQITQKADQLIAFLKTLK